MVRKKIFHKPNIYIQIKKVCIDTIDLPLIALVKYNLASYCGKSSINLLERSQSAESVKD